MPSTTRPRSSNSSTPSRNNNNNIGVDEVVPHLRTTLFITGAFCVAWSWDLVVYAISHVWWNEDPLDNQLAFGDQHGPKYVGIMLLQYLVVCGAAAAMSNRFRRHQGQGWYDAAVMAVEFFPSPVFAGKLMAYLGQFSFPPVHQALLNLAATWFAAFLAHLASSSSVDEGSTIGFWQRTGLIVRDTLGFGLGIAWNVLLAQFGPNSYSRLDVMHFLALLTYLLLVLVMALKLAAIVPDKPVTIWERHLSLLAFAMYVVCGFTLVGFLSALLGNGWVGSLESFGIVLVLAAIMSTMVAVADLDGLLASAEEQGGYDDVENNNQNTWEYKPSKFGAFGGILNCLIFVPCVWCCCPWVPLLILLAGMTESINVKEHWFKLIAMVGGLASSIEGSGMLTSATDALAEQFGICHHGRCYQPWMFVALQVGMAIGCTMVILPMIAPLAPSQSSGRTAESSTPSVPPATTSLDVDDSSPMPPPVPAPTAPTEEQPLLLYGVPPMAPPPVNPNYDPYRM